MSEFIIDIGDIVDLGPPPTTVVRGGTLSVKPGPVTGGPTPKVTIQWLRDGEPIEGATGLTYVTSDDDVDTIITVSQTAVNSLGRAEQVSANTNRFQINGAPPVIPTAPTISGDPVSMGILTANISTPTGTPTITNNLQWFRNGEPIPGATSSTYYIASGFDDVGAVIFVRHFVDSDWGSALEDSESVTVVYSPSDLGDGDSLGGGD